MTRASLGTAQALGLKHAKSDAAATTAYLMCGERCANSCAFCAQGRSSTSRADMLSRVTWPEFSDELLVSQLAQAYEVGAVKRACIQVVLDKDFLPRTLDLVTRIKAGTRVPLCVSVTGSMEMVRKVFEAGADRVSLPLDAASDRVYTITKGGSWNHSFGLLKEAAVAYPGRVGTHLICGLGETDQEMATIVQVMNDLAVMTALFSFTPVRGTPMENVPPPAIERYRAIQAARWLIVNGASRAESMLFGSDGRLKSLGIPEQDLPEMLGSGEAFMTSGCPDCNRPYYNERPGGEMYNFPRPLSSDELVRCIEQVVSWTRNLE